MKVDLFRAVAGAVTLAVVAVPSVTNAENTTFSQEYNREISIRNRTSTTMFYVFMSMPSEGWDEDWLAEDEVVMPDAIREFDVNDRYASKPRQCTFDIKVQYSNDVEHRLMGVNICSISRIDAMSDKLVVVY